MPFARDREIVSRLPTPARSRAMRRQLDGLHREITAAQDAGHAELAANLLNDLVELSLAFRTPMMPTGAAGWLVAAALADR